MIRNIICFAGILIMNGISKAQSASDSLPGTVLRPVTVYYKALGDQSPIYNAREYVDYSATINVGHPYYKTTEFVKASIHFDGMLFENVKLLYDIIKDKVILLHHNNVFRLDLPVNKIREFSLLDHKFIRLLPDSNQVIEEGFYEKLYEGKTLLFVKRKKVISVARVATDINNVAEEKDVFYIQKQGVYYPVKNLRTLLGILSGKSDQIRQYLKKNGVKFRKETEKAVLMAVKHYDRLSN